MWCPGLIGKTALITGSAGAFGRAAAKQFELEAKNTMLVRIFLTVRSRFKFILLAK
jgi:NAD(P)-dependent dehydrogenase (short-subunit alcohol dehydrogenase family)